MPAWIYHGCGAPDVCGETHVALPAVHGGRGGLAGDDGRKRPRSVMATDSEWRLVRGRAEKAGMSASEFLLSRGLAPAEPAAEGGELPAAAQRRLAIDLRLLSLAERLRLAQEGREGVWRRLVEEAEASVAEDEREA